MGIALYWDALKESGVATIVSVIDQNINSSNHKVIMDLFEKIADANQMSIYKVDKEFWLICAKNQNTFYLHQGKKLCTSQINNFKDIFLYEIMKLNNKSDKNN